MRYYSVISTLVVAILQLTANVVNAADFEASSRPRLTPQIRQDRLIIQPPTIFQTYPIPESWCPDGKNLRKRATSPLARAPGVKSYIANESLCFELPVQRLTFLDRATDGPCRDQLTDVLECRTIGDALNAHIWGPGQGFTARGILACIAPSEQLLVGAGNNVGSEILKRYPGDEFSCKDKKLVVAVYLYRVRFGSNWLSMPYTLIGPLEHLKLHGVDITESLP